MFAYFFDFFKSTIEAAEVWNKIIKATNPKLEESTENQPNQSNTENHVTPTMVFSVIGDSDSLVPRPWPTTLFQTALIEAAKSGGGTILLILIKYCNCILNNASTSNNMIKNEIEK